MNRRRMVGIVTVAILVLAGGAVAVALIWRTHMMRAQPTITLAQAGDTAERYVRDSVAQLPGKPTLAPQWFSSSIPCAERLLDQHGQYGLFRGLSSVACVTVEGSSLLHLAITAFDVFGWPARLRWGCVGSGR
jgi:hypothetical protein